MTTRLKTVHYAFPATAAVTDNTLTTLTQITVYLPETGTKTFRSVVATMSIQQTATAAGNITTHNMQCRLGAAAYTAHNQTNLYTGSGEDIHLFHCVDLTAHFTTNWSGTSMTMDCQVQIDGTATSIAFTNCCVTVAITYEYDDTSTTQVKTVFIPLNAPVGALATSKPGAATATIPDLDADLPEASKVYRNEYVVVQGNLATAAGTTDITITMQLDSTSSVTTGIFEAGLATDYFFRYVWNCAAVLDETNTMGFFIWGNAAKVNHVQTYLVVTYEFDASANTGCRVSLMLPLDLTSPMGGTTSADYQRGVRELFIEEPGTITSKEIAYYAFWEQAAAIAGLNMRIGTGSFVTYTDTPTQLAGSNAGMVRNDAAFTLARGRNELNFDIYRTDTTDLGFNVSGFFIINYNCSTKPTGGLGAANHTVFWQAGANFDGAAATNRTIAAWAPVIPETDYYLTALGIVFQYFTQSTANIGGQSISVERLAAEGGIAWEPASLDISSTLPETGLHTVVGQVKSLFHRWPSDPGQDRMNLETARRWRIAFQGGFSGFMAMDLVITYHTITFTVAGTVSGYADADGAGLTVELHRAASGELVKTATTTAGGDYTFTWYDNTENVFVVCFEDATHVGATALGVAT